MSAAEYAGQNCSIAGTLEAVGERWTLLIIRELLLKSRRFSDLERRLSLSNTILGSRLEKLVALGVVEKVPYEAARDWNRRQLTEKGFALFPVISALMAWDDAYEALNGPPAIIEHACERPARPQARL